MAQNSGVVLPKDLSDLVAQHQRVWADHDEAVRTKEKLERLAPKIPDNDGDEAALKPLSSTGKPPDELAAAAESLQSELKRIDHLQEDVKAAERRRFNMILTAVIAGVVILLIGVFALFGLGGRGR